MPQEPRRGITRRAFVRRAVGTAGFAAAGGLAFGALQASAPQVKSVQRFPYLGVKVLTGSKAPQGLPLIPVRRREDDVLEGLPDHLEWYRYCSRNEAPGLLQSYAGDDAFRFNIPTDRLEDARRRGVSWLGKLGEPVRAADLPGLGDGALATWRSEGARQSNLLGALVIRVDPDAYEEPVRSEFVPDGFLGCIALCAHLCCTPVYRLSDEGYHAGHWNDIVCDCHGSWYDPATIRTYNFPPTS